jgi:hypothetical protein
MSKFALPMSIRQKQQSGTLSRPARDESIMSVSKVLHRHILQNTANETEEQKQFDIDHFIRKSFNVVIPIIPRTTSCTVFKQTQKVNAVPLPDVQKIFKFIKRIFDKARLHAEAVIIALVYIERLIKKKGINLDTRNWMPILTTALLTASKMWDDHSSYNAEFAEIMPLFTLPDINELERRFLTTLNYNFSISSSEYARYYFGLRSLKKQQAVRNMPKYFVSLNLGSNAEKVEKKTQHSEADQADMPMSL